MTDTDAIPRDMEREPLANRLRQFVATATGKMPDAVRGHPPLNIHYLLATGTLTLWTRD